MEFYCWYCCGLVYYVGWWGFRKVDFSYRVCKLFIEGLFIEGYNNKDWCNIGF